jgi:hypothetical protein
MGTAERLAPQRDSLAQRGDLSVAGRLVENDESAKRCEVACNAGDRFHRLPLKRGPQQNRIRCERARVAGRIELHRGGSVTKPSGVGLLYHPLAIVGARGKRPRGVAQRQRNIFALGERCSVAEATKLLAPGTLRLAQKRSDARRRISGIRAGSDAKKRESLSAAIERPQSAAIFLT